MIKYDPAANGDIFVFFDSLPVGTIQSVGLGYRYFSRWDRKVTEIYKTLDEIKAMLEDY